MRFFRWLIAGLIILWAGAYLFTLIPETSWINWPAAITFAVLEIVCIISFISEATAAAEKAEKAKKANTQ
jgi:hypothetical protein